MSLHKFQLQKYVVFFLNKKKYRTSHATINIKKTTNQKDCPLIDSNEFRKCSFISWTKTYLNKQRIETGSLTHLIQKPIAQL